MNNIKSKKWDIICNIYSGGINSILSVVWVGIITRILGIEEAGIFTIAYSIASLLLVIGHWNMRNFQVSDISQKYSWRDYKISRILTSIVMLLFAMLFCFLMWSSQKYSLEKALVVFGVTLLKSIDAVEDVYHGYYQFNDKLYLAGFLMGTRLLLQMLLLSALVLITRNLSESIFATACLGILILFVFLWWGNKKINFDNRNTNNGVRSLLVETLPLFLASFLSFFLNNMSKYIIDFRLTDVDEAYYGYISMPVFVMFLLANFIFAPFVSKLSFLYAKKRNKQFRKLMNLLLGLIFLASLVVFAVGAIIGIPGLELIYGVKLKEYKIEFLLILIGSILYAFSTYFLMILTILRKQKLCLVGTIVTLCVSYVITNIAVINEKIMGASLAYTFSMMFLFVIYFGSVFVNLKKMN